MKILKFIIVILLLKSGMPLQAQTIYVNAVKGKKGNTGSVNDPLAGLQEAVNMANGFTGDEPVTIKIAPGLYTFDGLLKIENATGRPDNRQYTFEAMIMPDDTAWRPAKMPVIQSVADTNQGNTKFKHCVAFQVERNNVTFRGLKFLGNPRPGLEYYYVIQRRNEKLKGLEISQCYFIGDKNSAPIQGCVFAQGADIHIDHCVFYGCKNAVLVFLGLKDFSLTHSIIHGAYEAAVWYGYGESSNAPFIFSNNIIINGNYFWVSDKEHSHHYRFSNSIVANNKYNMGLNGMEIEGPDVKNTPIEINIRRSAEVVLNEVTAKGIPRDYLNLSPRSAGNELHAGIFKNQ